MTEKSGHEANTSVKMSDPCARTLFDYAARYTSYEPYMYGPRLLKDYISSCPSWAIHRLHIFMCSLGFSPIQSAPQT